ncbi:MAG: hypothetical protein FJ137_15380 [Deltaproteobacteria bacterium]|nr:hypothetical protein [Deltaproteobacteria bacterium]
MNADVVEAQKQRRAMIALALQAGRELTAAPHAAVVEESGVWEAVGAHVLPSFADTQSQRAARLVDEPRLHSLVAAREQRRDALATTHAALGDAVLAPTGFEALGLRRPKVDERLAHTRARPKERRARFGMLDALDAFRRGQDPFLVS